MPLRAMCGLACDECGAYIATVNDDDARRAETARMWSEMYGVEIKPDDINCRGCLSEGETVFSHCTVCEIRKCGLARGIANCAYCDEYACAKLKEFFSMAPECKTFLDRVRGES
jgi:hypothetical protein